MARPTKEEVRWWYLRLSAVGDGSAPLTPQECERLRAVLLRVLMSPPDAAPVQRGRRRQADQGVPLCRACHQHHDAAERCPE